MQTDIGERQRTSLYIDRDWLSSGMRLLPLARYLFGQREHALPTFRDEFVHNMRFEAVDLARLAEDCDFIYLPVNYSSMLLNKFPALFQKLEELSVRNRKQIIVESRTKDLVNPETLQLPFSNAIYLNPALLRSKSCDHFFALPYLIPDCLEKYYCGEVQIIEKTDVPTVGFCGVAAPLRTPANGTKLIDFCRLILTVVDDLGGDSEKVARALGTNMKHAHRCKAVLRLKSSKMLKFEAILRSHGGLVNNAYTNRSDFDSYNVEFYENLHRNLYSLCSRGTENYSVRFYESLCMGRIPILIDTDVVLPLDHVVDYERHCLLVRKNQISNLDKLICQFHQRMSAVALKDLQRSNRKLWCDHLSSHGFYGSLRSEMRNPRGNS